MRKHAELKMKEITGLWVLVLIWFVNLVPNIVDISINNVPDSLEIVASIIEVSQYKEKLFSWLLTEKLQVHLENDSQETVVWGTVSTDIL